MKAIESKEYIPALNTNILALLNQGKYQKTQILKAAQKSEIAQSLSHPYAISQASIHFKEEEDLINCIKVLKWSGELFKTRPKQLRLWCRNEVYREEMKVLFSVNWYTQRMFEKRKDAFLDEKHVKYYAVFNTQQDELVVKHQICQTMN